MTEPRDDDPIEQDKPEGTGAGADDLVGVDDDAPAVVTDDDGETD